MPPSHSLNGKSGSRRSCPGDCGPCMGGNCAHDVCTEGAPLAANCDPCVTIVCAFDSVCCTGSWDFLCVAEATSFCGVSCP
ncbi:MAG: hypothetical protein HUU21_28695 [Polyangiaceae bacterium]|nr:hypothetical protein [Polyangiaceae bacterium]